MAAVTMFDRQWWFKTVIALISFTGLVCGSLGFMMAVTANSRSIANNARIADNAHAIAATAQKAADAAQAQADSNRALLCHLMLTESAQVESPELKRVISGLIRTYRCR